MRIVFEPFWTPKDGNDDSEYEDAFYPSKSMEAEVAEFRFAVADGATESSFSKFWANQLVRYVCRRWTGNPFSGTPFCEMQRRWARFVRRKPLPWYAEEKCRRGAFSTIVGVAISDAVGKGRLGIWRAIAVGDSCLVQVRRGKAITKFPLTDPASFDSRPDLLSSKPEHNSRVAGILRKRDGTWKSGDAFYLMTDALACWFLGEIQRRRRRAVSALPACGGSFRQWIGSLRSSGAMRNDDVTLLRVLIR